MTSRIAVIYGGQGALGRAIVNKFKASHWRTVSVDVNANSEATSNVVISGVATAAAATADVERVERECATLGANGRVDAVICVAGGWRAGSAEDNDVFVAVEHMTAFNLFPAISAAHLAARVIAPGGLFVLTGALAALKPQPGMLAYGLTKCATHYLLKSVAVSKTFDATAGVLCVAPVTLDTASNRAAMPDNDRSTWTPCELVADKLFDWATVAESRPARGSLVSVVTAAKQTEFAVVADF